MQDKTRFMTFIPPSKYQDLIDKVCEYYGIKSGEYNKLTRKKTYVLCRQVIMYLLHKHTNESLKMIGEIVRPDMPYDHTTVIHGQRKIKGLLDVDVDFRLEFQKIEEKVMQIEIPIFTCSMGYKPRTINPYYEHLRQRPKGFIRPY